MALRGHDHGIEGIALVPRETARHGAQHALGHSGHVVVEVFLEMRVIGGDAGQTVFAGMAQPGVVGGKGRLDMHQIEPAGWPCPAMPV